MKKTYQAPETEVILLDACDILTLSIGGNGNAGIGDGVIADINSIISGGISSGKD